VINIIKMKKSMMKWYDVLYFTD